VTAPNIPTYSGTTPQRTQTPTDFANNADDWLTYQAPLASSYNSLASYLDGLAVDVEADKTASATSASESATSATNAQNYATSAASSANFAGEWSSLTGALNTPATALHTGVYWQLLTDLADVTASEPATTNADWVLIDLKTVEPKTSGATLSIFKPNELQDGSSFIVPLANSVPINWYIEIEQPLKFAQYQPVLIRSGSDLFADDNGTDTSITFTAPTKIKLTSNGVDEWRI